MCVVCNVSVCPLCGYVQCVWVCGVLLVFCWCVCLCVLVCVERHLFAHCLIKKSRTLTFQDVCFSKLLTFHNRFHDVCFSQLFQALFQTSSPTSFTHQVGLQI